MSRLSLDDDLIEDNTIEGANDLDWERLLSIMAGVGLALEELMAAMEWALLRMTDVECEEVSVVGNGDGFTGVAVTGIKTLELVAKTSLWTEDSGVGVAKRLVLESTIDDVGMVADTGMDSFDLETTYEEAAFPMATEDVTRAIATEPDVAFLVKETVAFM